MRTRFNVPAYGFCVGDRTKFAVEAALPAIDIAQPMSQSWLLSLTEGYFTFFVNGLNVFQIEPTPNLNETQRHYSALSLSMVLEWVYFDKAYALEQNEKSFAEIINGESAPDIRFRSAEDNVLIEWDLRDWMRSESKYSHPEGCGSISYYLYFTTLGLAADSIIAISEWRAHCLGHLSEWRRWLSGYQPERDAFRDFVQARLL